MKNFLLVLIAFVSLSCKKETLLINTTQPVEVSAVSGVTTMTVVKPDLNVKSLGAKGDGVTDDTKAIRNAIIFAKANNYRGVYFPAGTYSIQEVGITTGIIPLLNGVSLKGAGKAVCHLVLSGGRYNPRSMFYQAFWAEPVVSNIIIEGIDFDGNLSKQKFDAEYQYCHAFSINNGANIEVRDCLFQAFRGDGCLFGDTFLASKELRITTNVNVHDNEFVNIYREGAMFCCTKGATFYKNYVHGDGYLVGGVDIERHGANETVLNVSVYDNTFDFTEGYGPVERGGPKVKYRRAVTMGYFYEGYPNRTVDGRAGGHKIFGNRIFQGQIDCWGHTDVSITNNSFQNVNENITGVTLLSAPVINVSDPNNTIGLKNVTVSNNTMRSKLWGNGILFNHYTNVVAKANKMELIKGHGINIYNASGLIDLNTIANVGTVGKRVSGIVVNGSCSGLVISNNIIFDNRVGNDRTMNFAVAIQSKNDGLVPPIIAHNRGINMYLGLIAEYSQQLKYNVLLGNVTR